MEIAQIYCNGEDEESYTNNTMRSLQTVLEMYLSAEEVK